VLKSDVAFITQHVLKGVEWGGGAEEVGGREEARGSNRGGELTKIKYIHSKDRSRNPSEH
jgi:hypothetical protein